jgi:tetratricopeptide (TPR) repeat protein
MKMKKLIIATLFLAIASVMDAQVKTPQSSPLTKVEQIVGLTTIQLEYYRPSAKGRTVYGDLVPYGKNWRTGANGNSTISFTDDATIDGKVLKKGKYALFTTPKADTWDVYFYSDTNNWGLPEKWDESKVALKLTVKPETLSKSVESFTISLNNLTNDSGTLDISWERTNVSIPFSLPTNAAAMASIEKALAGPTAADYFAAAQFYYQSNNDIAKALIWINKAVSMTPDERDTPFWYLRMKSLIQAKAGDKKGAIATAKESLALSVKAGNADYEKMNKDSIAEWSK